MSTKNIKLRTNPDQKSKVKVRVTPEAANLFKSGKIPLAALVGLFGGIGGAKGFDYINDKLAERDDLIDDDNVEDAVIEDDTSGLCDYEVPTSVEFSSTVTNDMSFGEAFEAAREELGQGGFFTWKGQHYNTYTKEEWDSFSDEDKKDFFQLFKENTDFENGNTNPVVPEQDEDEPHSNENEYKKENTDEGDENNEEEVTLDEFGSDEEIVDGLNDGEAYSEDDSYGEDIT